jgi:hypothetical protein
VCPGSFTVGLSEAVVPGDAAAVDRDLLVLLPAPEWR